LPTSPPPQSGGRWLVVAGTVAALAIAAVVAILVLGSDDDDGPVATGPTGSADVGSTTSGDLATASAPAIVVTVPAVTIPLPSVGLSPTVPVAQASGELPPGQPPSELGNEAALDTLAEACYAGDMSECDNLFLQSAFGSDYQTYGDTCAGRQPAGTGQLCSAVFASAVSATTNG